jgi:hypothetical protein
MREERWRDRALMAGGDSGSNARFADEELFRNKTDPIEAEPRKCPKYQRQQST